MGGSRPILISALARSLNLVLENRTKGTLIIVTTSLSRHPDPEEARAQADKFIGLLEEGDTEKYAAHLHEGRISACGGAIMAGLLENGFLKGKSLTSGPRSEGTGEQGETVCYGALSFE
jgi:AmmeMemoRadiSam system protein B